MNYLLFGADTYRSRRKLREIIAAYRDRHAAGNFNFYQFDAAEDDLQDARAAARGGSLFAAKKLIVLERPFTAPRQFDIARAVFADAEKSSDTLLVVWDETLDTEAEKRLQEVKKTFHKIQKFARLSGAALQRWIREEAAARGIAFAPAEAAGFAAAYGGDLWRMGQEMEKAVLSGGGKTAQRRGAGPVIFDLGDAFFSDPRAARRILLALIRAGEDEMRLFAYLVGHARALLVVKSYLMRGVLVPASAKIHPFVVKKATVEVRMLPLGDLVRALSRFLEEDRQIKTGISTARESLLRMLNS